MQETFACMHHEVVLHTFLTYTVMCICMHACIYERAWRPKSYCHAWDRVEKSKTIGG